MNQASSIFARANRLAPNVAGVVLVLIGIVGGFTPRRIENADAYLADVRESIEALPYKIGDWIGRDTPPTPAAMKLLRPNKILSRDYVEQTSLRSVRLLVVHCSDTRDMQGHYPPICYPAHGWTQLSSTESSAVIDGQAYPTRRYEFERVQDGRTQRMSIESLFIMPTGEVSGEIAALDRGARSVRYAGLGSAQIQIAWEDQHGADAQKPDIAPILGAMGPILDAVGSALRGEGERP
ncbi:MAG: exosortase-associated EpsI family protein [Phycisphaerales bacterium]|jgi:hypothetical protein|nr:exosortase-associated EpsI family protein [Phycisphaerales bacterium]